MRLDHCVMRHARIGARAARTAVATGEVSVNGEVVRDRPREVTKFDHIALGSEVLQRAIERIRIRLHKPVGVVSATRDAEHPTVLDLVDHPVKDTLHLAGRLDRSSSGLILLTNDSHWSEALTAPNSKVPKVYLVETVDPIPERAIQQFADGFHLLPEDLTTRPAKLELLSEHTARVTLHEGKWHQIKRMFHKIEENRLVSLHRESIGDYELGDLAVGQWEAIVK